MGSREDRTPPLSDASESDINRLVDDVLRSGKHLTLPADPEGAQPERYHARAIAEQMHRLAQQLSQGGAASETADDHDEWWFEVGGKRIGPISLKKIRFLWEDGELTPDSLCWHDGFPRWVSLFKVSELAEALIPKLHVDVDQAARAFARQQSGEWASPAGTAMEAANRKKLESAQKVSEPLPLTTQLDLANERAATYTALRSVPVSDEPDVPARPGMGQAVVSGIIGGLIASAAMAALHVLWPNTVVVQPIVINAGGAALVAAAAPAPVPVPVPAQAKPTVAEPVPGTAPSPSPRPAVAGAPAPAEAKPATAPAPVEPKKPETVEQAFAKAFADAPPDELTTGEVFEVVRNHKAQVDACVDAQRTATPDATGKLVMHWSVDTDGHVSDVSAAAGEMSKSGLADCLAKEISGWTFPKHALAHPPVDFPFKY